MAGGLDFSGSASSYSPEIVNAVDVFDPTTGGWQQATFMNEVSEDQWLFPLNDGRVMAMGAVNDGSSDSTAYAETYDLAADTWTPVSSLEPYYVPTDAIQLSDGRLLVFGALSSYSSMSSRNGKTVHVELSDGRQLNAEQFAEQFPEAKIYASVTDIWTPAGGMALTRINASLTLLRDGRVLVAGGEDPAGSELRSVLHDRDIRSHHQHLVPWTQFIRTPLRPLGDSPARRESPPGRRDRREFGESGEIPANLG